MRLKIKEPEIEIGEDGFAKHCKLGRAPYGKKLSDLVERIDDPLVIALDGGWGSGKSFFLKCWAGAHKTENHGSAEVIYFDAFQHDYLDDPLIALTGVLAERFKSEEGLIAGVKNAALKIAPSLARIGLAAATAGVSELTTAAGDAALKAGEEKIAEAAAKYWEKEDGRRAAMKEFREALVALTSPKEEGGTPRKIVIIIDELDRCRPDFALALLEVIKHFFSIDHITFVLGVNLKELQNSVRARYGQGVDAERYLGKFIHLHMSLPLYTRHTDGNGREDIAMAYLATLFEELGIPNLKLRNHDKVEYVRILDYYENYLRCAGISPSLRDAERLASQAALFSMHSEEIIRGREGFLLVMIGAALLKYYHADLYRKLLEDPNFFKNNNNFTTLAKALGFVDASRGDPSIFENKVRFAWSAFLNRHGWRETAHEERKMLIDNMFRGTMALPAETMEPHEISSLFHEHLETFTLPGPSTQE